jgi:hypothetical protein
MIEVNYFKFRYICICSDFQFDIIDNSQIDNKISKTYSNNHKLMD